VGVLVAIGAVPRSVKSTLWGFGKAATWSARLRRPLTTVPRPRLVLHAIPFQLSPSCRSLTISAVSIFFRGRAISSVLIPCSNWSFRACSVLIRNLTSFLFSERVPVSDRPLLPWHGRGREFESHQVHQNVSNTYGIRISHRPSAPFCRSPKITRPVVIPAVPGVLGLAAKVWSTDTSFAEGQHIMPAAPQHPRHAGFLP